MTGHRPDYSVRRFLGTEMYYCRCSPNVLFSHLDLYDLHYDLEHKAPRREKFI